MTTAYLAPELMDLGSVIKTTKAGGTVQSHDGLNTQFRGASVGTNSLGTTGAGNESSPESGD